jgi:hypothetical protein
MTDTADWRKALTATERYDNIQKLYSIPRSLSIASSPLTPSSEPRH